MARFSPRPLLVVLHRWLGLFIAAFLFVAGLTGAVISWDHELDEWLNPRLFEAPLAAGETVRPALVLAAELEQERPGLQVTYLPLRLEPGHSLGLGVGPRPGADGQALPLAYNQVALHPASGEVLGQRLWGEVSLSRENLLPFLYKLHYSLQVPAFAGSDRWGIWFMGIVALVWLADGFIAVALTLPAGRRKGRLDAPVGAGQDERRSWWARWSSSWKIRRHAGVYKFNFDLHRAGGLWVWALLFLLAFTSFSLNLYREVFQPLMASVSEVTPGPFESRMPRPWDRPAAARLTRDEALQRAALLARERGWTEGAGSLFYSPAFDLYGVQFFHGSDDHGNGGLGVKTLYLDGGDGRYLGQRVPWQGTAADVFVQLQFPVHSGRILGLPGRILISLMGLAVAVLSATGVYIWWKKRRGRRRRLPATAV